MANEKLNLKRGELLMERFFTQGGKNPFEYDYLGRAMNWISEEVKVTDDVGKVIFTQPNVRRPDFWSSLAIKVVASKYFWGDQAKGEREDSIEKLVSRVSKYAGRQALNQGYLDEAGSKVFEEELSAICLNQLAVFNSPVWFNSGIWLYDKNAGGVSAFKWNNEANSVVKSTRGDDNLVLLLIATTIPSIAKTSEIFISALVLLIIVSLLISSFSLKKLVNK